jgi:hypothetical protein
MSNIFTPKTAVPTPTPMLAAQLPVKPAVPMPSMAMPALGMPGAPSFAGPSAVPDFGVREKDKSSAGQFIIILGPPFAGKTTAIRTFPNAVFMNLDNKVPVGTKCIPFDDPAFCDRYAKRESPLLPPNRRDAVLMWLYQNVGRLPTDWTLVLDSFSALSDAFHLQAETVEDIGTSQAGNKALLKVFGAKLSYLEAVFTLLKIAPCRVIVTAHTQPEYNEKGEPTGGVKPFCTGSFSDKICTYATDVLRAYVHIDPNTGKPSVDATGRITGYRWKLKPDRACTMTGTMLQLPPTVNDCEATFAEYSALLSKYGVNETRLSPEPASAPANP